MGGLTMMLQKEDLINIREIITDMEPHLEFEDNILLCSKRIVNYLEVLIFD